jgi:hypothetical protein
LYISKRTCSVVFPMRVFLISPRSRLPMPSVRSVLRPTLPTLARAGGARHAAQRAEQRRAARGAQLLDAHVRDVPIGVEIRPDRIAHEAVDAGDRAGRIGVDASGARCS